MTPGFRFPQRRNVFGQTLSFIPAEIYITIFDEIQPGPPDSSFNETHYKGTLASLTLVCHYFRYLCQGRMFKHLRFYGLAANETDSTSKQIVGRRSWREALAVHDPSCVALSDCVKLITVSSWTSSAWPVGQTCFTELLLLNLHSVASLRALREVHLVDCFITSAVLDALAQIPELTIVEMDECTISDRYDHKDYSLLERKGWTTLRIDGSPMGEKRTTGDWTLFGKQLACLVDSTKLQHFSADRGSSPLLKSLFDQGGVTVTELRTLQISVPAVYSSETSNILSKHLPNARNLQVVQVSDGCPTPSQDQVLVTVEMFSPAQRKHLSCVVALGYAERRAQSSDGGSSGFSRIFGLWTPLLPVDLSFSFPLFGGIGAHVVLAVQSVFKLFKRCKTAFHTDTNDLYTDPDTLRIKVEYVPVPPTDPRLYVAGSYQYLFSGIDFAKLFDEELDTICPNLDHISVIGLVRPCEFRRTRFSDWCPVV